MTEMKRVIGVGSPIMDWLARVDDEQLSCIPGEKGGMELVGTGDMQEIIKKVSGPYDTAPGGSAANTIFALARLGAPCTMLGKLGNDDEGQYYKNEFKRLGGDCSRFKFSKQAATARCVSLITPDSERTMRTDLGAAARLAPEEITVQDFNGCSHAHIEGYLLFNRDLMKSVFEAAKSAGCQISLDLGSFEVVDSARDILPELLAHYVDVVMANEDEAAAFCGSNQIEEGLDALSKLCRTTVVKVGSEGSMIKALGQTVSVPAMKVDEVADTTGAGDFWAAGFLYGYLRGYQLEDCGRLGSYLGSQAVCHIGADLSPDCWDRAVEYFSNTKK